jgi:transcriptional regulator with XRE-family HTH domain
MSFTTTTLRASDLTEAEREWLLMGPIDGGVPGLVRRIRRMLDVSQRGLAELLGVSQSVVARWETARTSPRVSFVQRMLELAGITTRGGEDRRAGGTDAGGRRPYAPSEPLPGTRGPPGHRVVGAAGAPDDDQRGLPRRA